MESKTIHFEPLCPFDFSIVHIPPLPTHDINGSHIHDQCEIYVNVSGNVSFMVEGQLYPITRGSAIITRPFEYHHCIYHTSTPHEHYWILFSGTGNEALLDLFFDRPAGKENLLVLPQQQTEELLELCSTLSKNEPDSTAEKYKLFFELLSLLRSGNHQKSQAKNIPQELHHVLNTINSSFAAPLCIKDLARDSFISINTLERLFKTHLGVTPTEYIQKKRVSHGAKLLQQGYSVSQAAGECGYPDTSQFIALFKKAFGQTPLQYRKQII